MNREAKLSTSELLEMFQTDPGPYILRLNGVQFTAQQKTVGEDFDVNVQRDLDLTIGTAYLELQGSDFITFFSLDLDVLGYYQVDRRGVVWNKLENHGDVYQVLDNVLIYGITKKEAEVLIVAAHQQIAATRARAQKIMRGSSVNREAEDLKRVAMEAEKEIKKLQQLVDY